MTEPNLAGGLIGGALIGIAAALLLLLNGRIGGSPEFSVGFSRRVHSVNELGALPLSSD